MAPRYKSPIRSIEIEDEDGSVKAYSFALTLDAIAKLQELWGIDDFGAMQERLESPTPQSVKDVIFACMWAVSPETTSADAAAVIAKISVGDTMELVASIVQGGTSPKEGGETRPTQKGAKPSR